MRAVCVGYPCSYSTYSFAYSPDTLHLTDITDHIRSGETYHFSIAVNQSLASPFSPPVPYAATSLLESVSNASGLSHTFEYDGSGELNKVIFPYRGYLRWTYQEQIFSANRTLRAIGTRYLAASSGAAETSHGITLAVNEGGTVESWSCVQGTGVRCWAFNSDRSSWLIGLPVQKRERFVLGGAIIREEDYTWAQDPAGRPYIQSVLKVLDQGASYQTKTEQTLDAHGNVTQTKVYDFGNLSTPARIYTNTYVTDSNYTSRYIFDRLLSSRVSDGGGNGTITLLSNGYDYGWLTARSGLREHDDANYGTNFGVRGNVTMTATPGAARSMTYDVTGTVVSANDGNGHWVTVDPASGTNYAAPGRLKPNDTDTLATSMTYSPFLAPATVTGPNGDAATLHYDSYARVDSSTSRFGAQTTYAYDNANGMVTATVHAASGDRWTKTTLDGFGRAVKVEKGNGSTTVSTTESIYGACACSPLGKVAQVSQPYAPGGTKYYTTYSYDGVGRTSSVQLPDGASHTQYGYQGNTTTITDPAGNWKQYAYDAFGNLRTVLEPDPTANPVPGPPNPPPAYPVSSAPAGMLLTVYTYDLVNHLTQVSMPRTVSGTLVTQTRTFSFDATTQRLTSASNPENGTVSYTYNADGSMATRVDNKGQKTAYGYDAYGRLNQIRHYPDGTHEDSAQQVNLYYDNNYAGAGPNTWGRLAAAANAHVTEVYGYTAAGLLSSKQVRVIGVLTTASGTLGYSYNNEGQVTSVSYPATTLPDGHGGYATTPGPVYDYSYDAMGRAAGMTLDSTGAVLVNSVQYGAAGEMLQMQDVGTNLVDTYQYNSLLQLTRTTTKWFGRPQMDVQYTYSGTQNNGQITQSQDYVTGEQVNYTYDRLQRLISAQTTGPQWGLTFSYDGFGNRLSQVATKGTAPTVYSSYDSANHIRNTNYINDGNGNITHLPDGTALAYDVENRVTTTTVSAGVETYFYGPDGKRVYRKGTDGKEWMYFYGVQGERLPYQMVTYGLLPGTIPAYFAGRRLGWGGYADRLGSVRVTAYYPYGEYHGTASGDDVRFATYVRDSATGLDYAVNRYYSSVIGRFLTVDQSSLNIDLEDPQSWNMYTYVGNDPVNANDPTGEFESTCELYPWLPQCGSAGASSNQDGYAYNPMPWDKLGIFKGQYLREAPRFLLRLRAAAKAIEDRTDFSENCQQDIAAIAAAAPSYIDPANITIGTLQAAAGKTVFANGVGSTVSQAALFPNSPQAAAVVANKRIGALFADPTKLTTAVTTLGGNTIYVNPAAISGILIANEGLLMHELLHELGLTDDVIGAGLHSIDPSIKPDADGNWTNTKQFSTKLKEDCFTGKDNRN